MPPEDPELVRVAAWRAGLPEETRDIVTLTGCGCAVLEADTDIRDLRGLVAGIHRRLDLTTPFRWPGEDGRIVVDASWRDRMADAIHHVVRARPGLLSGAIPGEIALARSGGVPALRLEFQGPDGVSLVIWMQDADLPARSYLKNSAVALWFDGSTPAQAPWMDDVVRLMGRVAERMSERFGTPRSGAT